MSKAQIIRTEYSDVMKKSYIDYAMSVIVARALPDVRDGLKPVQRRTLYDMHEFNMCNMIHNNPPSNYITYSSILATNVNFNAFLKLKVISLQIHKRICRIN